MNEAEWLSSSDPSAMLAVLTGQRYVVEAGTGATAKVVGVSDRKLRLFACACARHAFKTLVRPTIAISKASILAIDYAERFADDDQSEVLKECLHLARSEALSAFNLSGLFEDELAVNCSGGIADITCNSGLPRWFSVSNKHAAAQADLLRHIVGNPVRPTRLFTGTEKGWVTLEQSGVGHWWPLTPLVLDLAQQLCDGDQSVAPILHDALLDAAAPAELAEHFVEPCPYCNNARFEVGDFGKRMPSQLAKHLRKKCTCKGTQLKYDTHPKGCWALDLILGKE